MKLSIYNLCAATKQITVASKNILGNKTHFFKIGVSSVFHHVNWLDNRSISLSSIQW